MPVHRHWIKAFPAFRTCGSASIKMEPMVLIVAAGSATLRRTANYKPKALGADHIGTSSSTVGCANRFNIK
jgi:hypothetical protein